jgi:hypothetical protein
MVIKVGKSHGTNDFWYVLRAGQDNEQFDHSKGVFILLPARVSQHEKQWTFYFNCSFE